MFSCFYFPISPPIKWVLIHSYLLISLASCVSMECEKELTGLCHCPGKVYTQPRCAGRQINCRMPQCWGLCLNVFSTVPRWQKLQKPTKWSMELQSRGRVPKSPVPFLPRRQTAKPRAAFRRRLLLPSRPKRRRSPRPRWRASYTASTSGRHTARKPPAGTVLPVEHKQPLPEVAHSDLPGCWGCRAGVMQQRQCWPHLSEILSHCTWRICGSSGIWFQISPVVCYYKKRKPRRCETRNVHILLTFSICTLPLSTYSVICSAWTGDDWCTTVSSIPKECPAGLKQAALWDLSALKRQTGILRDLRELSKADLWLGWQGKCSQQVLNCSNIFGIWWEPKHLAELRSQVSTAVPGFLCHWMFTPDNTFEALTATSTSVWVFLFPVIVNFPQFC